MNLSTFGLIVGTALVLAALIPFISGAKRRATLELLHEELRIERETRDEREKRHERDIARLSGRVDTLTTDFARVIAREVVRVMRDDGMLT